MKKEWFFLFFVIFCGICGQFLLAQEIFVGRDQNGTIVATDQPLFAKTIVADYQVFKKNSSSEQNPAKRQNQTPKNQPASPMGMSAKSLKHYSEHARENKPIKGSPQEEEEVGGDGVRWEPVSKRQVRNYIAYVVNEQTPFTGVFFTKQENGKLAEKEPYTNGKIDGVKKRWYPDGKTLAREEPYTNGKIDGMVKCNYESGYLSSTLDGNQLEYYPDIKKAERIPEKHKDDNGKILDGVVQTFYKSGQLNEEDIYTAGWRNGVCKSFYENGQLAREYTYVDDKLNGPAKHWYEKTGELKSESNYKDGKLDGEEKMFSPDGKLIGTNSYKDGKQDY
jgi:antitoxin component YwqK of YwqJK toxin-antitoxin module